MDSSAMVDFSQAVGILLFFAVQHWLLTIIAAFLAFYMVANLWIIGQTHGSVAAVYREDGLKEAFLMFFFGIPRVIWAFCDLLSSEVREEEEY